MNALGFIEITGVVAAVDALDIMCKSADVQLVTWERKLGGRLVTIIVEGDIAAVTAAVENATKLAIKKPAAHLILANPHEETWRIVQKSAARLAKKKAESPKPEITEMPKAEDVKADSPKTEEPKAEPAKPVKKTPRKTSKK